MAPPFNFQNAIFKGDVNYIKGDTVIGVSTSPFPRSSSRATPSTLTVQDLQNATFQGNTTVIEADTYVYVVRPGLSAKLLSDHVAHDAMCSGVAPCLAGTREQVLAEIKSWINEKDPEKPMLWITGPIGAGKSAIATSVEKWCEQEGINASSFHFSALPEDRPVASSLVATLAWQMFSHPDLRHVMPTVLQCIKNDPGVFHKRLEYLLEALILAPLRAKRPSPDEAPPSIIVIDGLDTCKEWYQKEIFAALQKACADPAFPFRILYATRPERSIATLFKSEDPTKGPTLTIDLDAKYSPDLDIALYFQTHFAEIRELLPSFSSGWPGNEDMDALVAKTGGNFAYGVALMNSIDVRSHIMPLVQLDSILDRRPLAPSVERRMFSELDEGYLSILQTCRDPKLVVQWLLAIDSEVLADLPAIFIDRFLQSLAAETAITLWNLPSVFYCPPLKDAEAKYRFHHHSFKAFLVDPDRNKEHFVEESIVKKFLLERYIFILKNKGPDSNLSVSDAQRTDFLERFVTLIPRFEALIQAFSPTKAYEPDAYLSCDAEWWVQTICEHLGNDTTAVRAIYANLHRDCSYWPKGCIPACKLWKTAIKKTFPTIDFKN
ncbi:hypothetical protein D9611_004102 [Ephemerocybe angulata]|uniref:Nephrocystin 3-like N-terminal domain-containing protein n=1 Tax=Ephemerocybe angulata TaxID=980116 RepID=A0A8H5F654_9AGAR|nr:hypothetical protein D9611_004102 [Tulosesus angulatus]